MAIKLQTEIKNLSEENLVRFMREVSTLDPNLTYRVYFVDKKPFRSIRQNSYLWGVVYDRISQHTGYEPHEVHEMCKAKFGIMTKFDLNESEVVEYTMSTRMMSTTQMTNYIDSIRNWAREKMGLYIPAPNEISAEDFINSKQFT